MELGLNLALLDQAEDMPKLTVVDVASVKTAVDYRIPAIQDSNSDPTR